MSGDDRETDGRRGVKGSCLSDLSFFHAYFPIEIAVTPSLSQTWLLT